MHRRASRIALPICAVLVALIAAPGASAASGNLACTASLTPQGSFQNPSTVPITLEGNGSCVRDNAVQAAASFTLTGNATITNCFSLPYIDIKGTLTTTEAGAGTQSTPAELQIESLAGINNGVGILTTDAGEFGALVVTFTDLDHAAVLDTIQRCGGGAPFTFTTSGAFAL